MMPSMQLLPPMQQSPASILMKHRDSASRSPEQCQVCGTSANVRKNFGVPSCVSCRIFYSRNTGKQLVCYQNGNCRIEGPSRKSCAACRFRKCMRAGMQKSRERKYKYRKGGAAITAPKNVSDSSEEQPQPPQPRKSPAKTAGGGGGRSAQVAPHPPLELFKDIGGLDSSVMDKSMFVHFYKMADMFRVPLDCCRDSLVVRDTFSGLSLLEAVTKRTLAIVRFLPHFAQLDRGMVSAMVSEKISGLISILRTLHFEPPTGLMVVRCAASGADSSEDYQSSTASLSGEDVVQQPLLHIVNGLFADLTKGDSPLMTDAEVATVYLAALRLYSQCHSLFRDRLNIGVTLLLGMYFFLPDYKTVQLDEGQMRAHQSLYLRCLQDLLKVLSRDPSEAMDMYNRVLFLMTEVKSVDFYLSLLSRHVRFRSDGRLPQ